jgi:hypothetical protein
MKILQLLTLVSILTVFKANAGEGYFYDINKKEKVESLNCVDCESYNIDLIIPHHAKINSFDRIWMQLVFTWDGKTREYEYVLLQNEYDVKYGDSVNLRLPVFRNGETTKFWTNSYNSQVPAKDMCKISRMDSTFLHFEVYGQTKTGTRTEWSESANRAITKDTYSGTKIQETDKIKLNQSEKQLKKNKKRNTWWYKVLENFPIIGWLF